MRFYTNEGYCSGIFDGSDWHGGERSAVHCDVRCERHAPARGSAMWKRQGWRVADKRESAAGCSECADTLERQSVEGRA